MKRLKLTAEPRQITGKKVKKLRREGLLPANVYGKDIKSQSLQLPLTDFMKVFEEAGETGVIDLTYGEKTVPVLIHNLHTLLWFPLKSSENQKPLQIKSGF
jgi:large subunit ribosomal protein L25